MKRHLTSRPNIYISLVILIGSVALLWYTLPGVTTYHQDLSANQIFPGTVTKVVSEEKAPQGVGQRSAIIQTLLVDVEVDDRTAHTLVHNDLIPLKEGNAIYVRASDLGQSDESFDIVDVRRQGGLLWLALLFIGLTVLIGGRKGIQALIGLVFSLAVIFSFIIPRILAGNNPVLIGLFASITIIVMNVYLTDGFNHKSIAALIGIFFTLAFTAILTSVAVAKLHFTGYTGEDSLYFNQETHNTISLVGILIAGIGLSALGVLDDVAVTQVSTVLVLARSRPTASKRELFFHAMEVGHDHIAAVINTLALAYIGAALPLLLLLTIQKFAIGFSINIENISTEIIRILISTSGIVLVVPITTFIAVIWSKQISAKSGPIEDIHQH